MNELEDAVMASMNEEVGSEEMPNIFSAYADAAYTVDKRGKLADISACMSEEELDSYVDSYIEEGRIGKGNTLRIFPTAKSSEIFMMNKTDWDKFAEASGASLDDLSTGRGDGDGAEILRVDRFPDPGRAGGRQGFLWKRFGCQPLCHRFQAVRPGYLPGGGRQSFRFGGPGNHEKNLG